MAHVSVQLDFPVSALLGTCDRVCFLCVINYGVYVLFNRMDHQTKEIINISPSLARKLYRAHQGGRVSLSGEEKEALWRLTGHPVHAFVPGVTAVVVILVRLI